MEREPAYDAGAPLDYESFYHAMESFQRRHPVVDSFFQDHSGDFINPVRFEGVLTGGMKFAISYSSGEDDRGELISPEGVGIGIQLQKHVTQPDSGVLDRQIAKMHHDIPGTEGLIMYGIPEPGSYTIILEGDLLFADGHASGDVDALFDRIFRAVPAVRRQFFTPYTLSMDIKPTMTS